MKNFFNYQGNAEIMGSRDASREAFKYGLVEEGEIWMDMIESRNLSSHTYNEEIALEVAIKIVDQYFNAFQSFGAKMKIIEKDNP